MNNCIGCDKTLVPVLQFSDGAPYEDALDISFSPGYGEFFDGDPVRVYLCKGCAHRLCQTFPKIGKHLGVSEITPESLAQEALRECDRTIDAVRLYRNLCDEHLGFYPGLKEAADFVKEVANRG